MKSSSQSNNKTTKLGLKRPSQCKTEQWNMNRFTANGFLFLADPLSRTFIPLSKNGEREVVNDKFDVD